MLADSATAKCHVAVSDRLLRPPGSCPGARARSAGRLRRRRNRKGGASMIRQDKTNHNARYGMVDRSRPLHRMRRLHGGLRGGEQRPARRTPAPTSAKASPGSAFTRWTTARSIRTSARPSSRCCASSAASDTPCAHVCPQQAVDVDPATGIVGQMPERCLGCRYCMAACPYHARYFNWWDPEWPAGMEKTLNPDVAPRMRGVVEKCNFCHGRWHAAKERAAAAGKAEIDPGRLRAGVRGSLPGRRDPVRRPERPGQRSRRRRAGCDSFRLLESLGTEPKVYYRSKREWVREIAKAPHPAAPRRRTAVDKQFITRGVKRCSTPRFLLWMPPWAALLAFGLYAAGLCLVEGSEPDQHGQPLRLRAVDLPRSDGDRAGRGRVFHRLSALHPEDQRTAGGDQQRRGDRAGLLQRRGGVLVVDVGQPLRAWFTFWYPNVHSMLTEVTFCITCYLTVLLIEYVPIVLQQPQAARGAVVPGLRVRTAQADVCARRRGDVPFVLPPGLAGRTVRRAARPAVRVPRRPGGVALHVLPVHPLGRGRGAELHPADHLAGGEDLAGSGWCRPQRAANCWAAFRACCSRFTCWPRRSTRWSGSTARRPDSGFPAAQYYSWQPFGTWILFAEIVVFGLLPALILLAPRLRARTRMAGFGRGAGVLRRGAEPLRADRADAGAAHALVRPVPFLLPELAGDRARSWRWWRTACWCIRSRSATSSCSRRSGSCKRKLGGRSRKKNARPGWEVLTCFPWNYGFHWIAGTMIFMGAFYTVLVMVATTVISAVVRARGALWRRKVEEIRWHADFHDLPARDRACRHVLTGEFKQRECPNAFDCRECETHAKLIAKQPVAASRRARRGDLRHGVSARPLLSSRPHLGARWNRTAP